MGNLYYLLSVNPDDDPSIESKSDPLAPIKRPISTPPSTPSYKSSSEDFHGYSINAKYIPKHLVSIAAEFWITHIETLPQQNKLELGCSIFFAIISNKQMNDIKKYILSKNINLKKQGLKFLDMIGYLIQNLLHNGSNLHLMLQKLGLIHQRMGVKLHHFDIMIDAAHESMSYYLAEQYNVDVQYAMDQIITISARIMMETEKDVLSDANTNKNRWFLQSLEVCLSSHVGRQYFYSYLDNKYCHESVVYLQLIEKFRKCKERYTVAKELVTMCIVSYGKFAINISYETRKDIMDDFDVYNGMDVPIDYFKNVELEMRRLIFKNHWYKFVDSFE